MTISEALAAWHRTIEGGSHPEDLAGIIADDAVFHSPVVHTPQAGKAKVVAYLSAAGEILGGDSFRYVRELVDAPNVLLEFETEFDGVHVNGIDMIRFDESGRIVDFKVMIRPLKAVNKVWELMAARLERGAGGG